MPWALAYRGCSPVVMELSVTSEDWKKSSSPLSKEETPVQRMCTPPLAPPGILSVIDRKRDGPEVVQAAQMPVGCLPRYAEDLTRREAAETESAFPVAVWSSNGGKSAAPPPREDLAG